MSLTTGKASVILMTRAPVVSYFIKPSFQSICLNAAKQNYVAAAPISLSINKEEAGKKPNWTKGIQPKDINKEDFLSKSYDSACKSNKFLDLNLPGRQKYKFAAQTLTNLKNNAQISRSFSSQSTPPSKIDPKKTSSPEPPTIDEKPSKRAQLKRAFKEYGATIMAFHVAISLISLGGFYALVSGGIDLISVLEFLGFSSSTLAEKVATGSTFVVAFAIHKIFAPIRISITLGTTPFIVRYLRSKGFLKTKSKAL